MSSKKFMFVDARGDPPTAIVHTAAYATAILVPYRSMASQIEALISDYQLPDEDRMTIAMAATDFFSQPKGGATFIEHIVDMRYPIPGEKVRYVWKDKGHFFDTAMMDKFIKDEGLLGSDRYRIRERDSLGMNLPVSTFSLAKKHERRKEYVYNIELMMGGHQWMGWILDTARNVEIRVVWINDCFCKTGWEVQNGTR